MKDENKDIKEYINQTLGMAIEQSEKRMVGHFDRAVKEMKQDVAGIKSDFSEMKQEFKEMKQDNVRIHSEIKEIKEDNVRIFSEIKEDNIRLLNETKEDNIRLLNETKENNIRLLNETKEDNDRVIKEMKADNIRHMGALREGFKDDLRIVVDTVLGVKEKTELLEETKADKREVERHNKRIGALEVKFGT